ncbi:hypothetical protein NFHSH190041_21480 [Shewanella sp. NFH-SH190041]|nr:hypothetical protein NFHSH190041_21480 [Shewanella sp. NFH-SH190041]
MDGAYRVEIYHPEYNNLLMYAYSFSSSHQHVDECTTFNYYLNETYRIRVIANLKQGKNTFDMKQSYSTAHSEIFYHFASGSMNEEQARPAGYFTRDMVFDSSRYTRYAIYGRINGQSFRFTIPVKFDNT